MNKLVGIGLDGTNPLYLLASLGAFRLLALRDPEARMAWVWQGGWRPEYCWEHNQEGDSLDLAAAWMGVWLRALGTEDNAADDGLGVGIAHLGDIIGVTPPVFRAKAKAAVDAALLKWCFAGDVRRDCPTLVADALASQGCDAVLQDKKGEAGRVRYTPFSFGNGGGGQSLLKDFRNCAKVSSDERVLATLTGKTKTIGMTNLNWDPADQRSYALRWRDPEDSAKSTDPVANALAFVGLTLLTAAPAGSELTAMGWGSLGKRSGFIWPIWHDAMNFDAVRALLSLTPEWGRDNPSKLAARGIAAIFAAERLSIEKRYYFAPARPA